MKRFLQAAFKITLFQILLIAFFSTLKYILVAYKLFDKIQKPFVWTCIIAGIIFVVVLSIIGIIEKRNESYEKWLAKAKKSRIERVFAFLISWGFAVPVALAYVLVLYMIAPTSLYMFIALYAGIVFGNIIEFYSKRQTSVDDKIK